MLRSGGRTSVSVSGRMADRPYSTSLMLLTSAKVIIKFEYTIGTVANWDFSEIKITTENILHNKFCARMYDKTIGEFPRN